MATEGNIGRYDPNVHTNPGAYINLAQGKDKQRLRRGLVLAGYFTPLSKLLRDRLITLKDNSGLPIPNQLSGTEPLEGNYSDTRGMNPWRKFGGIPIKNMHSGFNSTGHMNGDANFDIHIPIGEYGSQLALSVSQAVRALYVIIPEMIRSESQQLLQQHRRFIVNNTYWKDPLYSMLDSTLSIAQAFAILSSDLNPHFREDPVGLFRKFIGKKTFNQYSRLLLFGDNAALAQNGFAFRHAVDPETFKLKPELISRLIQRQKHEFEMRNLAGEDRTSRDMRTIKGCPVAAENTPVKREDGTPDVIKESGINLTAEVFALYLEHYYSLSTA